MSRLRRLAPFLFGFTLATLAGMVLRSSPVMAQQTWQDLTISRPAATQPAPAILRGAQGLSGDAADAPMMQPGVAADARVPVDTRPMMLRRREQADGETEPPVSEDLAVDGHMETAEPVVVLDGREEVIDDPRLPADRAAFLAPPAGYDALAFQIELSPAADGRPKNLARFEPYQPVGQRSGSWVVFPTVEVGIGATGNVYRSTNARPDLIFDVRPTLLAVTDWQRHAVQVQATGLGSAYQTNSTENDRAYAFELRGRLDVTRQANIEVLAAHSLDQEARSATFAPADAAKRAPYATDKVAMAFNQGIGRLSVQLRGAVTEIDYQPVPTYSGAILSNDERDLTSRDAALRAAWSFSPTLALFAELAGNTQSYRTAPADGIGRDSTGDRARVGLSFGTQSQIWRGEIALGYGHQRARDGRMADVEGMLVDANLAWRPTQLTSLLFNARTDFLTSTVPGQGGATQRNGGIELRHAFLRQLNGVAGVSLQVVDYQGLPLREETLTGELGAEYYVSKSTALLARYSHAVLTSTAPGGGAITDAVRVGVRYRP